MRQVASRLGLLAQDSQWVTAAISAGAVLISSAAAAWITHYFTGRTERRRQEHADIQEAAKREHEAKLSHEQRIREQVIATSTTISKMLQDFRSKIGEATEAADTLAATLLYDESGERPRPAWPEGARGVHGPAGPYPARPGRVLQSHREEFGTANRGACLRERTWGSCRLLRLLAGVGGSA